MGQNGGYVLFRGSVLLILGAAGVLVGVLTGITGLFIVMG